MSALFDLPTPPTFDRWRVEVQDVATLCANVRGADLVHADPPWSYNNAGVEGSADEHYSLVTNAQIAEHVAAAHDSAAPDCYLVLWCTWPKLAEWMAASADLPWRYVTGASWHKTDRMGIGFHVRGDSEPLLIYVKGKPKPLEAISNRFESGRGAHSEKPVEYLARFVRAFCRPDGLVMDLYAGRAPLARACALTGRRYVGAEIDPDRAALARAALVPFARGGQ